MIGVLRRKLILAIRKDGAYTLLPIDNLFNAAFRIYVDLVSNVDARDRLPLENAVNQVSLLGCRPD